MPSQTAISRSCIRHEYRSALRRRRMSVSAFPQGARAFEACANHSKILTRHRFQSLQTSSQERRSPTPRPPGLWLARPSPLNLWDNLPGLRLFRHKVRTTLLFGKPNSDCLDNLNDGEWQFHSQSNSDGVSKTYEESAVYLRLCWRTCQASGGRIFHRLRMELWLLASILSTLLRMCLN